MLFITIMTKSLIQSMRKRKNIYEKLSEAGRHGVINWETKCLEVLVVLVALSELPRVGRN